jgi:hypothetical protein
MNSDSETNPNILYFWNWTGGGDITRGQSEIYKDGINNTIVDPDAVFGKCFACYVFNNWFNNTANCAPWLFFNLANKFYLYIRHSPNSTMYPGYLFIETNMCTFEITSSNALGNKWSILLMFFDNVNRNSSRVSVNNSYITAPYLISSGTPFSTNYLSYRWVNAYNINTMYRTGVAALAIWDQRLIESNPQIPWTDVAAMWPYFVKSGTGVGSVLKEKIIESVDGIMPTWAHYPGYGGIGNTYVDSSRNVVTDDTYGAVNNYYNSQGDFTSWYSRPSIIIGQE